MTNINRKHYCIKCGIKIPVERKKIMPETLYCVNCVPENKINRRRILETWGSRDDWKNDQPGWDRYKS